MMQEARKGERRGASSSALRTTSWQKAGAHARPSGRGLAPLVVLLALACASQHEPLSPIEGVQGEVLDVQVVERPLVPGERTPTTRVTAQRSAVALDVVRRVPFCAPLVDAVVLRGSGVLDVVATVGGNPGVNCVLLANSALSYHAVVPRVSAGQITVRLFERLGEGAPVMRAQATVVVRP